MTDSKRPTLVSDILYLRETLRFASPSWHARRALERVLDHIEREQADRGEVTEVTIAARVALIRKGLHGGNSDPNRCVCAERETGTYADTPHTHRAEWPHSCARCGCPAYVPVVS